MFHISNSSQSQTQHNAGTAVVREFADFFAAKRDKGEELTLEDMALLFQRAAQSTLSVFRLEIGKK